jgi:hypothetical protein
LADHRARGLRHGLCRGVYLCQRGRGLCRDHRLCQSRHRL